MSGQAASAEEKKPRTKWFWINRALTLVFFILVPTLLYIQARNIEAMEKFKADGDTVTRLSQEDLETWRKAAIPIWFNWANKNDDARAILDIQLKYMMNDTVGYITEEDIKGF